MKLQAKFQISSRINIPLFEALLVGYDPAKALFVSNGLHRGFPMGLVPNGPTPPTKLWAHSFVSAPDRVVINTYLAAEIDARRIFGPFTLPPRGAFWGNSVVYPMSLTFRKDGRPRIISNLSSGGKLLSVNGFIPQAGRSTSYPSFREVAEAMVAVGLNTVFFCLFDIENAYRALSIQPEDWKYSIICWQEVQGGPRLYFLDAFMVFGGSGNCQIFNKFGDSLGYILKDCAFIKDAAGLFMVLQRLLRYLDDFLVMASSAILVDQILVKMLAVMRELRIPIKMSKTIWASISVKFLGYLWLPRSDRITLDAGRWIEVEGRLFHFRSLLVGFLASAQDLRCLTGLLVWASVVIPTAKVFNRGFHTVLQRLKATSLPASEARLIIIDNPVLISDVLFDLSWWIDLCASFRLDGRVPSGIKISEVVVPRVILMEDCPLVLYSDASNLGIGGYRFGMLSPTPNGPLVSLWCFSELPPGMSMTFVDNPDGSSARRVLFNDREVGSGYTESAALLYTLYCFLPAWAAAHPDRDPGVGVWCHSDSDVLVKMWASKRAGVSLLPYLRAFARLSALYNITLVIVHIPGITNTIADAISRQKFLKMRRLLPSAAALPTPPLSEVQVFF